MAKDKKEYSYEQHDLPDNAQYRAALEICHRWLTAHMGRMFSAKQIGNFMKDQPITAAKHLMERTDNPTETSILVAMLGPAKFDMINHSQNPDGAQNEAFAIKTFGIDTVNLIRYIAGMPHQENTTLERDKVRLFMVEGLSTMHDQLIGRKRIDPHHEVRWNILRDLETNFKKIKGQNPQLDPLFEDAMKQSRAALEALDTEATAKKPQTPKPPKM